MHFWLACKQGKKPFKVLTHARIMIRFLNCLFATPVCIDEHRSGWTAQECSSLEAWKARNNGFMPFLHIIHHALEIRRLDRQFYYLCDGRMPVIISHDCHLPCIQ